MFFSPVCDRLVKSQAVKCVRSHCLHDLLSVATEGGLRCGKHNNRGMMGEKRREDRVKVVPSRYRSFTLLCVSSSPQADYDKQDSIVLRKLGWLHRAFTDCEVFG